jgi:hypothetical protein
MFGFSLPIKKLYALEHRREGKKRTQKKNHVYEKAHVICTLNQPTREFHIKRLLMSMERLT